MTNAAGSTNGSGGSLFALEQVLQLGHDQGINGGTVAEHLAHAQAFVDVVKSVQPMVHSLVDLGSGGGYPGLVLATALPSTEITLVEVRQKRADYLRRAVRALGIEDRVAVFNDEASALADSQREAVDVVTARSFGPPALVVECAAPLLRLGGVLVASEPPQADPSERWPPAPLLQCGLRLDNEQTTQSFVVLEKDSPTTATLPRPRHKMERKPLF